MKLICINNDGYENKLTVEKEYEIEKELSNSYAINDDEGGYSSFPKSRFSA